MLNYQRVMHGDMVCQLARVAKLVANSIDWGGPLASSIWATPYSLPSKPYRGSTWIGVTGALGTRHIPTAGYTYIFELYCHTNHKHIKMTCNDLLIKPKIQLQICSSIIQYDINMMHQKRDSVEEVEQVLTNRVVLLLQTKYVSFLQHPLWPHAVQIEPIQFVLVRRAGPLQPQFEQDSA